MKANLLTIHTLIVLISGLISCSPDNGTSLAPEASPSLNPIISNSDGTFSRLDRLEGTSVRNTIQLDIDAKQSQNMLATSHAVCKASFLPEPVEYTSHFNNTNSIAVAETLPLEVFKPSRGDQRTVVCQHSIKIYLNDTFTGEIIFKDIVLTDTDTYSNYELPFLNLRSDRYFLWHDLKNEAIQLHTTNMEVRTLCDQGQKYSFPDSDQALVIDLIDDSMFEATNTQHCRLVFTDRNMQKTWLTPSFYIQNYQPTLSIIDYSTNFPGEAFNDLEGKILAEISIRNESQIQAYIGFSEFDTNVSVIPIFGQPEQKNYRHLSHYSISARWTLKSPLSVSNLHIENKPGYEIPANGVLTFQLRSKSRSSSCGFEVYASYRKGQGSIVCRGQLTYSGSFYRIEHMPTVDLDLTTDLNFRRAQRFDVDPKPEVPGGHLLPHWSPLTKVAQKCGDGGQEITHFDAPIRRLSFAPHPQLCTVQ